MTTGNVALSDRYFDSTMRAWVDQLCMLFQGSRQALGVLEWLLFLATIALALRAWPVAGAPHRTAGGWSLAGSRVFLLAMLATLVVCRWPVIALYDPLGFDESVLLAGAITLKHDPIFWRTVQSTTSGPLNVYPLMWPAALGMPIDYAGARLLDLALVAGCLILLYKTARLLTDEPAARLSVLPAWAFYVTATSPDFVQYTSEAVPVLIQTLATFLALRWLVRPDAQWWHVGLVGLLLGLLPFAKLQAVPAGAALGGCLLLVMLIRHRGGGPMPRLRQSTGFVLCAVAPTALVLALVGATNLTERFVYAFVRFNLNFAAAYSHPLSDGVPAGIRAVLHTPQFGGLSRGLAIGLAVVAAVATLLQWRLPVRAVRRLRTEWPLAAMLCVPLAVTFLAVVARKSVGTRWFYFHYLLFLVVPMTLAAMKLADWIGAEIETAARFGRGRIGARYAAAVLVAGVPVALMAPRLTATTAALRPAEYYAGELRDPPAIRIAQLTQPDDALVVWGWRPDLYVQTQRRQGCSFGTVEREMGRRGGGLKRGIDGDLAYFQAQFMQDLERSQPALVVDSTGLGDSSYLSRQTFGLEVVLPAFAQWLDRDYEDLGEFFKLRLYRRRRPTLASHGDGERGGRPEQVR